MDRNVDLVHGRLFRLYDRAVEVGREGVGLSRKVSAEILVFQVSLKRVGAAIIAGTLDSPVAEAGVGVGSCRTAEGEGNVGHNLAVFVNIKIKGVKARGNKAVLVPGHVLHEHLPVVRRAVGLVTVLAAAVFVLGVKDLDGVVAVNLLERVDAAVGYQQRAAIDCGIIQSVALVRGEGDGDVLALDGKNIACNLAAAEGGGAVMDRNVDLVHGRLLGLIRGKRPRAHQVHVLSRHRELVVVRDHDIFARPPIERPGSVFRFRFQASRYVLYAAGGLLVLEYIVFVYVRRKALRRVALKLICHIVLRRFTFVYPLALDRNVAGGHSYLGHWLSAIFPTLELVNILVRSYGIADFIHCAKHNIFAILMILVFRQFCFVVEVAIPGVMQAISLSFAGNADAVIVLHINSNETILYSGGQSVSGKRRAVNRYCSNLIASICIELDRYRSFFTIFKGLAFVYSGIAVSTRGQSELLRLRLRGLQGSVFEVYLCYKLTAKLFILDAAISQVQRDRVKLISVIS